jgi:chromosome segregation ATPase
MSDSERPEGVAFRELEQLVRHLGDELAGFRRRALVAEARLRELGDRLNQLEHDNAVLRGRLEAATARTQAMLDRVRFIRQQAQGAER